MSKLFCSCLQFSVLTRFVCSICLHFGPVFGGVFADKVCLQDLSAFWPIFGGFSADKVCLQDLSVRVSCADKLCLQKLLTKFVCRVCLHFGPVFGGFSADKVCLQDLSAIFVCILARVRRIFCRQSLSAELSVRVSCADKLCLQKLQTNFVCRTC